MRGRHFPRLCRSCDAPLARKDDACWRCHAAWVDHEDSDAPPVSAGTSTPPDEQTQPTAESAPDAHMVRDTAGVS